MKKADGLWVLVLAGIVAFMMHPATHAVFVDYTTHHPYISGFIKFFLLASMGELLAIRIVTGNWKSPQGFAYRAIIWGFIGMFIVLVFGVFGAGVRGAMSSGLLPGGKSPFLIALYTAGIMNLTAGVTLMIGHRLTDTYLDLKFENSQRRVTWTEVVQRIDWNGMVTFVLFKTIPFFWIPAHTLVFLLPEEYRVMTAALLSIALGSILAFSKRKVR